MTRSRKDTKDDAGRFAYEGLDRVLHEKARLGILTSLAIHPEGLLFNEIKELCLLSDGNLSRHLQTLQEAELIEIWKRFHEKRPQTLVRLTAAGRERFLAYIDQLEKVLQDAAAISAQGPAPATQRRKATDSPSLLERGGWSPA